jgi:hypothetical protein
MLTVGGDLGDLIDDENDPTHGTGETGAARAMRRDQEADELLRLDFLCRDHDPPARLTSDGLQHLA